MSNGYAGGDFRSPECVTLLKEADIVVTNPPFSLFREYIAQLVEHDKKFLILGNQNAITYKEIFSFIKDTRLWLGVDNGGTKWFQIQDEYEFKTESRKKTENGIKYFSRGDIVWFTNLDHGRRHEELPLMTMADNLKFSKKLKGKVAYDRYVNYDGIDVATYKEIPADYDGVMGVPVTFLSKYNPDQFEIVANSDDAEMMAEIGVRPLGREFVRAFRAAGGTAHRSPGMRMLGLLEPKPRVVFKRILIRHRRAPSP